tara:strand:+ start:102 stop:347 length:246 start_codon:yes stop_codon:yes gene_type:complete
MENTKIIKRLIQHYIEGSELTQDEHFEVRSLEKKLAAINYTRCCESDSEQLFCGCGKNKPLEREPAYLHCDWCGSITVETK